MNKLEIIQALNNGLKVYWRNNGYEVFLDNGRLYTIFTRNDYMSGLQQTEYNDCFIED